LIYIAVYLRQEICSVLNFDPSWRLMSPGKIAGSVINDLTGLIRRVAAQHGNRQHIVEHYKGYFADAANRPHHHSSSLSWAETDLEAYMREAGENAPMFIEAFYDAGEALKNLREGIAVPDVTMINHVLSTHDAGYEVSPPQLIARRAQTPVEIATLPPSLDAQAHEKIQRSLKQSEEYLTAGKNRQAVQEILWLLETVSTAFQAASGWRRHDPGKVLQQDCRRAEAASQGPSRRAGYQLDENAPWLLIVTHWRRRSAWRHTNGRGRAFVPRGPADLQLDPKLFVFPAR
jgi:hypothetical protein